MSILIDTGVIYALLDKSDNHNLDAKAVMLRILKGNYGSPFVTDYVLLESFSLLGQRGIKEAVKSLQNFLTENKFRTLFVTEEIFSKSMELTLQNTSDFLSLADSSQIILSISLSIDAIATFDSVLGNFFKISVGKGYFSLLEKNERELLVRKNIARK